MNIDQNYNYEELMILIEDVLDLIVEAIENNKQLSLGRYGHGEIAFIGEDNFPEWKKEFDTHGFYAGATASVKTIKNDLFEALKTTDIVGLHASWGEAWEDREAAKMTKQLFYHYNFKLRSICSAFITHEMIKSDRFWEILKDQRIALVGRRAAEAITAFKEKEVNITYTTTLEGYKEIEKVYNDLSNREDWDIALLAAGIPATILAPRLANKKKRVVIDFGHALDKLIDGENFNYLKLLRDWKDEIDKNMIVTMVMAVYNGEKFLEEAIGAALSQTYENLEIIIVNDCSTDSTKNILNNIDDERVRVINLKKNQGAANALNIGIREAKGQWIAIQDADDNSYPTRIEEQVKYIIEHPNLVGVGTFIECIPGGEGISEGHLKGVAEKRNSMVSKDKIKDMIYEGCPITHSSVMFCKDTFFEVGGYNTDFKIDYDHDLWLRLLEKGDIENVPKVLLQYRIHKKSLSHKDDIATVNEIQIASSRGIYRYFNKSGLYQPKVIVIGARAACINYNNHIAPLSSLQVKKFIYKDWDKQVISSINMIKKGEIDAIIVLTGFNSKKILEYLKRNELKLNNQVFNIYNILE